MRFLQLSPIVSLDGRVLHHQCEVDGSRDKWAAFKFIQNKIGQRSTSFRLLLLFLGKFVDLSVIST
jgi:hypothetical protein